MFINNLFPKYVEPSLLKDDVVSYLIDLKNQGWDVLEYNNAAFIIDLGNDKLIKIEYNDQGKFSINSNHKRGVFQSCGIAQTTSQLEKFIKLAAGHHQVDLSTHKPQSVRLSSNKPASNIERISSLIGTSTIQAIFDPYLENKSLQALTNILSLKGSIATDVRLLSKVPGANLTKTFVDDWFKEHGCINGEIRILPKEEHRRFLLLSSSESLILGPSLNSINKNEAASLESDKDDRNFFDDMWKKSNKFI